MLERYLKQATFSSLEDFQKNFAFKVPADFNFACDVVDGWAEHAPDKLAMLWTNDKDEEIRYTFGQLKEESDRTASFFQSLGIGKGDMVMLILKRRHQFWTSMLALNKIGAIAIPATFLLTAKDIVYRCEKATIKAIICCGDEDIMDHIDEALPDCPSVEHRISIGPEMREGWLDFNDGVRKAAPFVNRYTDRSVDDYMLMYFTSGTSGEPKMVVHDNTYALGHITTAAYWHNLHENSLHLTIADTGWAKAAWGKLYGQWFVGATVFVYDHEKFTPADILHKIEQYKVTSLCAPPTIFRFLIREDLTKFDLSSLEYCTTAGEGRLALTTCKNPVVLLRNHPDTGESIARVMQDLNEGAMKVMFCLPEGADVEEIQLFSGGRYQVAAGEVRALVEEQVHRQEMFVFSESILCALVLLYNLLLSLRLTQIDYLVNRRKNTIGVILGRTLIERYRGTVVRYAVTTAVSLVVIVVLCMQIRFSGIGAVLACGGFLCCIDILLYLFRMRRMEKKNIKSVITGGIYA